MPAPGMEDATPVWYHYKQIAPIELGATALQYSFAHWVDDEVAAANLRTARDLCMEQGDVDRLIAENNVTFIQQRLQHIDALARGMCMAMNVQLWTIPAFVRAWRRFISGGDLQNIVVGGNSTDRYAWTRDSDLEVKDDSISARAAYLTGEWRDRAYGGFGDGRSVRTRNYGKNWLAGIRRGEWAERLRRLYNQYATDNPNRTSTALSMFAPTPWWWFLETQGEFKNFSGMSIQCNTPWSDGDATHVHSVRDGNLIWQKRVATDKAGPPSMGPAPVNAGNQYWTNWSYHHDFWGGIKPIVAITPPGVWMFEFYRTMFDEMLQTNILQQITQVRKYVTDRNVAVAQNNRYGDLSQLKQAEIQNYVQAGADANARDPNAQAAQAIVTGVGGTLASVGGAIAAVSLGTGPGAIVGAAIGGAMALTGLIIGLVDQVSLKDDMDPEDHVDEMGRVKPILLPAMIWFKSVLEPNATPPMAEFPEIMRSVPVTGWVRNTTYQSLKSTGGDAAIDFVKLPVPAGFRRTPNRTRQSIVVDGVEIQYSTRADDFTQALELTGTAVSNIIGRLGRALGAKTDADVGRVVAQAAGKKKVQDLQIAQSNAQNLDPRRQVPKTPDGSPSQQPHGSPSQQPRVNTPACTVEIPESFALESWRDEWIREHPECYAGAMARPVQIPMWWYAAGGAAALAVTGTVIVFATRKPAASKTKKLSVGTPKTGKE